MLRACALQRSAELARESRARGRNAAVTFMPAPGPAVPQLRRPAFPWPRQARFALPCPVRSGPVRFIPRSGSYPLSEILPMAAPAVAMARLERPLFPARKNPGPLNRECLPRQRQGEADAGPMGFRKAAPEGQQGHGSRLAACRPALEQRRFVSLTDKGKSLGCSAHYRNTPARDSIRAYSIRAAAAKAPRLPVRCNIYRPA